MALKTNLANLKTELDKLDIDKLVPINIDTSNFVLKTKSNTDKTELEKKIPDTSDFVRKTKYNTKITELENKIPDISNLATKTTLIAIEYKIPSVSNLVKKTDCNTKITDIENKLNNHNYKNILILQS